MSLTIAQKERRKNRMEYVRSKKNVPCADCRIKYPSVVMDFHHLDRRDELPKKGKSMVREMRTWSVERIDKELNGCVVLCANCHRIRHHS